MKVIKTLSLDDRITTKVEELIKVQLPTTNFSQLVEHLLMGWLRKNKIKI